MSGMTNPAEEYFKNGLWAWDPAGGVWLKLIIDPLTNRLVIDHPGDLEVVQSTPADLCVANHGWDGSVWRKLPMVWGYSAHYGELEYSNDVSAGDNTLVLSTVPAGEVWVIDSFVAWADQNNPILVEFYLYDGASSYQTTVVPYPTAVVTVASPTPLRVPPGGYLRVVFKTCVAGDDIRATATGYKMKIAE